MIEVAIAVGYVVSYFECFLAYFLAHKGSRLSATLFLGQPNFHYTKGLSLLLLENPLIEVDLSRLLAAQ